MLATFKFKSYNAFRTTSKQFRYTNKYNNHHKKRKKDATLNYEVNPEIKSFGRHRIKNLNTNNKNIIKNNNKKTTEIKTEKKKKKSLLGEDGIFGKFRIRKSTNDFEVLQEWRKSLNEAKNLKNDRVKINVSGMCWETYTRTLERFPDTLLGNKEKRKLYFDSKKKEYFFDRNRTVFDAILYYYQSGGWLKRPPDIPADVFAEELRFYEVDEKAFQKYLSDEGYAKPKPILLPKGKIRRKMWLLFEYPESSLAARFLALLSVCIIVLSIVIFCVETMPSVRESHNPNDGDEYFENINATGNVTLIPDERVLPKFTDALFLTETACIIYFLIELCLRFFCCPNVTDFITNVMNIIDLLAIMPYIITFVTMLASSGRRVNNQAMSLAIIRVIRLIRVFRIFKLSRHSTGLKILAHTIRASLQELGLLVFFLVICIVLFSSAIYFAEYDVVNTHFVSIPDAFWWALVTMTTVGYGDMVPISPWGKLVGSMCAIAGVLTIALPVPVIVSNFTIFYDRAKTGDDRDRFMQLQAVEHNAEIYRNSSNESIQDAEKPQKDPSKPEPS